MSRSCREEGITADRPSALQIVANDGSLRLDDEVGAEVDDVQRLQAVYSAGLISRRGLIRRALAMGLTASSAGALLAACSGADPDATAGPSASQAAGGDGPSGRVQVLVGFGTGNAPAQVAEQEALAAAFTELNPDIEIEFLRIPGGSGDAQQRLTLAISSGEAPDLVMPAGLFGMGLFLDREVWLDLGDLAERDGVDLSVYREEALAAARATGYYGPDSTALIGLPVGAHTHPLAYNATLFEEVGVEPPPTDWDDPDWTYARFREVAIQMTRDGSGRTPEDQAFDEEDIAHYGVGNFFAETMFFAFGGQRWMASEQAFGFDSPGAVEGLQFAADLINVDRAQPNAQAIAVVGGGASGGEGELFAWLNGRLAMVDFCTCSFSSYGDVDGFEWRLAAMPTGPARRFAFLNLDLGAITQASENQDAAWEVLKFFALEELDRYAFDSLGAIPPTTSGEEVFGEFVAEGYPSADPAVIIAGLPSSGIDNEAWFPAFAEVNTAQGAAFGPVIAGEVDAATALAGLQQEATALAATWAETNELPSAGD